MPTEPLFALAGDCNASRIGRVARGRGIAFAGGPLGNGAALQADFFDIRDGDFVPRGDVRSPERFVDLFRCGLPLLSTVGSNIHRLSHDLYRVFYKREGLDQSALSDAVLRQVIVDRWPGPLRFYRAAAEAGCDVHAVHSTQRFAVNYETLTRRVEPLFLELLADLGVRLVDVRPETTDEAGRLRPEYHFTGREGDQTHANDAWAGVVLDRFLATTASVPT